MLILFLLRHSDELEQNITFLLLKIGISVVGVKLIQNRTRRDLKHHGLVFIFLLHDRERSDVDLLTHQMNAGTCVWPKSSAASLSAVLTHGRSVPILIGVTIGTHIRLVPLPISTIISTILSSSIILVLFLDHLLWIQSLIRINGRTETPREE